MQIVVTSNSLGLIIRTILLVGVSFFFSCRKTQQLTCSLKAGVADKNVNLFLLDSTDKHEILFKGYGMGNFLEDKIDIDLDGINDILLYYSLSQNVETFMIKSLNNSWQIATSNKPKRDNPSVLVSVFNKGESVRNVRHWNDYADLDHSSPSDGINGVDNFEKKYIFLCKTVGSKRKFGWLCMSKHLSENLGNDPTTAVFYSFAIQK